MDLKGWNLVIADANGGKAGNLNCKIPQLDNSLCLQPKGAQAHKFHGIEGVHSR